MRGRTGARRTEDLAHPAGSRDEPEIARGLGAVPQPTRTSGFAGPRRCRKGRRRARPGSGKPAPCRPLPRRRRGAPGRARRPRDGAAAGKPESSPLRGSLPLRRQGPRQPGAARPARRQGSDEGSGAGAQDGASPARSSDAVHPAPARADSTAVARRTLRMGGLRSGTLSDERPECAPFVANG